jgi:O-antigen ligase
MKALGVGLCVLLTFSVASFGAVQVWSESVVEIGAAILLVLWACLALLNRSVEVRWNSLNWPILGFCAIGAAQLLFHATAYPFLTRTELLRAVTCWAFFFLATQAFQSRGDFNALAWFLILLSFGVSLLGIIQYFTSGDRIYWMQQLAAGVKPFGPFVNRNHFAGFVELTLPTGLALLMLRGIRREQVPLMMLLTLVPISAVVLASSRAGIICAGLEVCGLAVFRLSRQRAERVRIAPVLIAMAAGVILIGWIGVGHAAERFLPSYNTSISMGKRLSMTRGALNIFLAHPVSGAGLGTTIAVYPRYETLYDGRVVDHVHDDYAEALAEAGVLGGVCGLAFLILLFRNARRRLLAEQGHFSRALHAGAIAAVGGLLLHSFVDFNLHIFSNALLFLLQAFVATAPALPAASSPRVFRTRSDLRTRVVVQAP